METQTRTRTHTRVYVNAPWVGFNVPLGTSTGNHFIATRLVVLVLLNIMIMIMIIIIYLFYSVLTFVIDAAWSVIWMMF